MFPAGEKCFKSNICSFNTANICMYIWTCLRPALFELKLSQSKSLCHRALISLRFPSILDNQVKFQVFLNCCQLQRFVIIHYRNVLTIFLRYMFRYLFFADGALLLIRFRRKDCLEFYTIFWLVSSALKLSYSVRIWCKWKSITLTHVTHQGIEIFWWNTIANR